METEDRTYFVTFEVMNHETGNWQRESYTHDGTYMSAEEAKRCAEHWRLRSGWCTRNVRINRIFFV